MELRGSFLYLLLYSTLQTAMVVKGYETCWDETLAVDYTGVQSTTTTGRTCQPWALDTPHSHSYHGNTFFPYDGDDVAAGNYCRDPDGTSGAGGTWCYTMDVTDRWDTCIIPKCLNLPCSTGAVRGQATPTAVSANVNSRPGTIYLISDPDNYDISCCGTIQQWRVYIKNPGTITLQIWKEDITTGDYILKGQNTFTYVTGQENAEHIENVLQTDRISVEEGWLIGWYAVDDIVGYDTSTVAATVSYVTTAAPSIGDSVTFTNSDGLKDFAIGLEVTKSLLPTFTNTATTATIAEDAALGDTAFTLAYKDDDPYDGDTLVLSMTLNTYFQLSGNDIVVKSLLSDGTETLDITVRDHCDNSGTITITVTITPVAVSITSLPDSVNVSESTTSQTPLHELVVHPADDTYTCTIISYLPTRPEGNPFVIANTATADNVIFLANAANVRYNTAQQLNVTVTCTNSGATDSDTDYLIVNIDPNSHPNFTSFVGSATFSARTTNLNDVVYTATVTDAEGNPISLKLTCNPTGCPFDVDHLGQVYAMSSLSLHQQATYDVTLTANDTFNAVDSGVISFFITDINVKPTFTNLPGTAATVYENQATGTSVFQVSYIDANGDTITSYTATYANAACAGMYDITAGGEVITRTPFDYEIPPQLTCTISISAFDAYENSDPQDLIVNLGDVDEPPDMSNVAFTITTEELPDNTALPDQSISATNPEGGAITLSLNCGANTGRLSIHPTTGIVSIATATDLELENADTYTIYCTITATDFTGQTSTASLTVTITDGNTEDPIFVDSGYSQSIIAGFSIYTNILTVSATDIDRDPPNNQFTYSLSPTTEFNIGPTGNIYNTADLSGVAAGTVYNLIATATDHGAVPRSGTVSVVITVTTTTTAATTTTTTAGSGTDSGTDSGSTDFFGSIGNIILLALAGYIALAVSALLGVLVWKCCFKKNKNPSRFRPDQAHTKQPKARPADEPETAPKLNNRDVQPKSTSDKSFERLSKYYRPRYMTEVGNNRFNPNSYESGRPSNDWYDPMKASPRVSPTTRIDVTTLQEYSA